MEVTWMSKKGHISQMYSRGVEFALISKEGVQIHPFVFCKDFLQDVIFGYIHVKRSAIYGFEYDPKKSPPVDMEKTRLCIADAQMTDFRSRIEGSLEFVNYFAKKMKIKPTREIKINEHPHYKDRCAYLVGSKIWQNAPPMISLYSLLLRAGMSHKVGTSVEDTYNDIISGKIKTCNSSDKGFLTTSKAALDKFLKFGYRKFFYIDSNKNYPIDCSISTMHSTLGICGFSTGATSAYVPYWHRMKVA